VRREFAGIPPFLVTGSLNVCQAPAPYTHRIVAAAAPLAGEIERGRILGTA